MSVAGLRLDGRRPGEVRRVRCELGVLPNFDGSANLEQGNTKVAVTITGPCEATIRSKALHDRARLNCTVSMAAFSSSERRRRRPGDRKMMAIARAVESTFEAVVQTSLFKGCEIGINVHILQTDGGVLSAAINAVNMALIDAGVPMFDLVTSCTVGYADSTALLDVNYLEESTTNAPMLTVAVTPKSSKVVLVDMANKVSVEVFTTMLELAMVGCRQLSELLDGNVRDRTEQLLKARGITSS